MKVFGFAKNISIYQESQEVRWRSSDTALASSYHKLRVESERERSDLTSGGPLSRFLGNQSFWFPGRSMVSKLKPKGIDGKENLSGPSINE